MVAAALKAAYKPVHSNFRNMDGSLHDRKRVETLNTYSRR
jgi:hypothetical protein